MLIALINKRHRKEFFFLAVLYLINIYLYATTFSFDRYAQPFLVIRFIAFGLALYEIKLQLSVTGKKYLKTTKTMKREN
jgi:hypothetical protein